MTVEEFLASLQADAPPGDAPPLVRALWLAGKGDWEAAHALVGDLDSRAAALIHAHLHRQEGDLENARYWYQRADRAPATVSVEEEWNALVIELVADDVER
ncbi:MAG TPA: hypothetical protein VFH68_21115 [Polyangia bacterium]|jgi:hypothetical protein|nr:hypothetical protein [Polyangia bacterium]